ncbi:hypothetical protein Tsubulata_022476 [Turnera subulata]|uniref:Endonuclease/exonuclease/phosphatase domain-containing protein n=1 Tax=Turnera subulata TaxID=218843 RepID=A0A9Q0J7U1_9ROSI|nr:hypothetical protein Tsubulata_022476 [Turnera subulata]
MSILTWNCQGLGPPLTVSTLRELKCKHRPSIMFLMETKQDRNYLENLRFTLGYQHACYVDGVNTAGGLALWWLDSVHLQVLGKCTHFFDVVIQGLVTNEQWHATFVYGDPYRTRRRELFDEISELRLPDDGPWLCVGDLNALCSDDDKCGGSQLRASSKQILLDFIDRCGFIDLGFKGSMYTWSNRHPGARNIRERLDRGLANCLWRLLFPKALVFHECLVGSDHRPLVIQLDVCSKRAHRTFKFESKWTRMQDCHAVVHASWSLKVQGPYMFVLNGKLKACQGKLVEWAKRTVGNCKSRIDNILKRIDAIHDEGLSEVSREEERGLLAELEILWGMEEMHWHQRSRINWLTAGDQNTRFFHCSTVQRRQRNQILKLKSSEDQWVEGEDDVLQMVFDHFNKLFTSEGVANVDEVLSYIPSLVSVEDNQKLCCIPDLEEIKAAAFDLELQYCFTNSVSMLGNMEGKELFHHP